MSGVTAANRMLPTREDVVGALFERRVAFAGGVFEPHAIHDLNMPAAVADNPCATAAPQYEQNILSHLLLWGYTAAPSVTGGGADAAPSRS